MIAGSEIAEMTGTQLRRASADDLPALMEMYASFEPKGVALGLPPLNEELTRQWLERLLPQVNFVVWLGDELVAHGVLCPNQDSAEVAVFVHQDARSRGFGKLMLAELISAARKLGLRRVWGITETDNVAMLRLAYSLGFVNGRDPGEFYLDLRQDRMSGALPAAA